MVIRSCADQYPTKPAGFVGLVVCVVRMGARNRTKEIT